MSENNVQGYVFGDFELDLENLRLLENGIPVSLTQKSFELLQYLIEHRGRVLKKEDLLDTLWEGSFVEEANLTQHIYMLRKALKQKEGRNNFIETIPKNGYRFLPEVRTLERLDDGSESRGVNALQTATVEQTGNGHAKGSAQPFQELADPELLRHRSGRKFRLRKFLFFAGVIAALATTTLLGMYLTGVLSTEGTARGPRSIAVLPFDQIEQVKDEKLGLGIADVLIARLASLDGLSVLPTTSIIRFSGSEKGDLSAIGEKLKVAYLVSGSVQLDNGMVRVTTQLYDVEKRRQVWSSTYDEKYSDIFSLQDSISEKVAAKISDGFDLSATGFSFKRLTGSERAFHSYSMGLSYWTQHSRVGFRNAIRFFKQAIEEDPKFVLAYAYLADSYAHHTFISDLIPRDEALRLGEKNADKALALDPDSAEALSAKALILASRKQGSAAFTLMQRSISLNPNNSHARHRISWMYANRGDMDRAVAEMKEALRLEPQSVYLHLYLSNFLYLARRPSEAIEYDQKVLKLDPGSGQARWRKLHAQEEKGDLASVAKQLESVLEKNDRDRPVQLFLSRIYAKLGKKKTAKRLLDEAVYSGQADHLALLIAMAHIALGDRKEAIGWVDRAVRETGVELFTLKFAPNLDPIRDEPRFRAMISAFEKSDGWR